MISPGSYDFHGGPNQNPGVEPSDVKKLYVKKAGTTETTYDPLALSDTDLNLTELAFTRPKDLSTTITAFRTGDVIPVDGPSGTAKMGKDDLLNATAENALKDCIAVVEDSIFQDKVTNPADLNDIKDNGITFVQRSYSTATLHFPSDYPTDSQKGYLLVVKTKLTSTVEAAYQWLLLPNVGYIWSRAYNFSTQVWSAWTKSGIDYPQVLAVTKNAIFLNEASNPADLNDLKDNCVVMVQRSSDTTTQNFPSDYPTDGERSYLFVTKSLFTVNISLTFQMLFAPMLGKLWFRVYSSQTQTWTAWNECNTFVQVRKNAIFLNEATNPADLNDLKDNTLTAVVRSAATTTLNFPTNYPTDSQKGFLLVTRELWTSVIDVATQMLFIPTSGKCWFRTYNFNTQVWSAWDNYIPGEEEITIGSGGDFATLRAGFTYAYSKKNCRVKVLPGTYDLAVEFADVLHSISSQTGLPVGKGMKVFFCDGATVKAEFDNGGGEWSAAEWQQIVHNFNPFYSGSGDFEIENLNIVAKNCRYCFHDERSGTGTYRHVFKNCHMLKKTTTSTGRYMACIGAGLGEHGTIVVDGGDYKSETTYGIDIVDGGEVTSGQMAMLFHNGDNVNAKGSIIIKDAYIHDRGYICIRDYGPSENVTEVLISGCSAGLPVAHFKILATDEDNMEAIEWCNEQRVEGVHWEPSADGTTIDLVND